MTKTQVNTMISHLKKAGKVTNITPWMFEEQLGEKVEVRYVGLKLDETWAEIFSLKNLLLLKFLFFKKGQRLDILLANKPPFLSMTSLFLEGEDKIEKVLGELKRQLKQDKQLFQHHQDNVGNLYKKIAKELRK